MVKRTVSTARLRIGFTLACVLAALPVAMIVNAIVPDPYMDEYFHVHQSRAYCAGQYSVWDSKITTFPGLYVAAVGLARVLTAVVPLTPPLTAESRLCATPTLRMFNLLLSALTVYGVCILTARYHPAAIASFYRRSGGQQQAVSTTAVLKSLECYLFPLSFFFYFLYYTDTGSTCAVVWSWVCATHYRRHYFAALLSGVAVLFRQTNVIWCVFICVYSVLRDYQHTQPPPPATTAAAKNNSDDDGGDEDDGSGARSADVDTGAEEEDEDDLITASTVESVVSDDDRYRPTAAHHLWPAIRQLLAFIRTNFFRLLRRYIGYALVAVAFVAFVVWNGGIVVGDRENHTSRWHVPQLFYFFAFTVACFGFKALDVSKLLAFARDIAIRMPLRWAIVALAMTLAIQHQTDPAHPFLLADNRHVPFYLWKNVFRRFWWARYALVPVYQYGLWLILRVWTPLPPPATTARTAARPQLSLLFAILYLVCVAVSVVLSPLIEFRYFIIPFVVLLVHDREHAVPQPQPISANAAVTVAAARPLSDAAADVAAATGDDPIAAQRRIRGAAAAGGPNPHRTLIANIIAYACVNAAILYLFLYRPFTWPDNSIARFMW